MLPLLIAVAAVVGRAASAPTDRSSPKSAAVALYSAVSAGDRNGVAASLYAADAEQRALADAMADFIVAGKALGDAARGKFGKAADPIGSGMLDPSDL